MKKLLIIATLIFGSLMSYSQNVKDTTTLKTTMFVQSGTSSIPIYATIIAFNVNNVSIYSFGRETEIKYVVEYNGNKESLVNKIRETYRMYAKPVEKIDSNTYILFSYDKIVQEVK
jgi:hypothetical protein